MRIPKIFVPEKNLEKNVQSLLTKEKHILKESPVLFEDLEIEPNLNGERYNFCHSLSRLKEVGYERHLRPWESFSLIIECLENRLPPDLESFAQELIKSKDEWLSMAIKRKGNTLFCYVDPQNLKQNQNGLRYFTDGMLKYNHSLSKNLSVKNIPSGTWVSLDHFSDEFVKYFYNRKLKSLPKKMREEPYKAGVYIPPEGDLWPVSRGRFTSTFHIFSCHAYASSVGVKKHLKVN